MLNTRENWLQMNLNVTLRLIATNENIVQYMYMRKVEILLSKFYDVFPEFLIT